MQYRAVQDSRHWQPKVESVEFISELIWSLIFILFYRQDATPPKQASQLPLLTLEAIRFAIRRSEFQCETGKENKASLKGR